MRKVRNNGNGNGDVNRKLEKARRKSKELGDMMIKLMPKDSDNPSGGRAKIDEWIAAIELWQDIDCILHADLK